MTSPSNQAPKLGTGMRQSLLCILTDLYVQKPTHSDDEQTQYTTLALRLIDEVDLATRAAVAATLSGYQDAPRAVVDRLNAANHASLHRTPETLKHALPAGPIAAISTIPSAAEAADAPDFRDGFFAAGSIERRRLLASPGQFGAKSPLSLPKAQGCVAQLERAALRGRPHEFIGELETALSIPRTIAERIVNDPSGEPLVVVAKALAMPIEVLQRILLLVNPAIGHSVRRVFDLSALYQDLQPAASWIAVSQWQVPRTIVYQSTLQDTLADAAPRSPRGMASGASTPSRDAAPQRRAQRTT